MAQRLNALTGCFTTIDQQGPTQSITQPGTPPTKQYKTERQSEGKESKNKQRKSSSIFLWGFVSSFLFCCDVVWSLRRVVCFFHCAAPLLACGLLCAAARREQGRVSKPRRGLRILLFNKN